MCPLTNPLEDEAETEAEQEAREAEEDTDLDWRLRVFDDAEEMAREADARLYD